MTIHPKIMAKASRKIADGLERGYRKAAASAQKRRAEDASRRQRAKYKIGAAQSPTPPPGRSIDRDEKLLRILQFAELDFTDSSTTQLVERLAGNILFEQGLIDAGKLSHGVKPDDELLRELTTATGKGDRKVARRIVARIKHRTFLQEEAAKGRITRPYGWNKSTTLLKSLFYALAMEEETAPFNLALTPAVVTQAKEAKHQAASHLQDRLRKLLTRRLPLTQTSFWFRLEHGGGGGFHLHGAVTWPTNLIAQGRIAQSLLSLSGGNAPTQLKVGVHLARAGWAAYVSKHAVTTEKVIGGKTLVATRDVSQRARDLYDHFLRTYITLSKR